MAQFHAVINISRHFFVIMIGFVIGGTRCTFKGMEQVFNILISMFDQVFLCDWSLYVT